MPDKKSIKEQDSTLDPKVLDRAMGLLNAILDNKTPEALRISMTEWFCSDWSMEEKYTALERIMHERLLPNYEHDPFATQKLKELKERLKRELDRGIDMSLIEKDRPNRPNRPGYFSSIFKFVVVLIPVLIISGLVYFGLIRKSGESDTVAKATVETINDVQKEIILPDGSHVWVNSGSRITYPEFFDKERYVQLEGEAYFEIQHLAGKPFYVKTEHINVKVLGTKFNVFAYTDKEYTEVSLNEGSVEVRKGKEVLLLKPDEKLTYNHNTGSMIIEQLSKAESWRSDVIYAKRKTLAELFLIIENYYDTDIVYEEGTVNNTELFTIALHKKESAEKIISILSETSGSFTFKKKDGKIYIEK